MSNMSSTNSINKIHINSSTKMTLSDRFTAFSAQPKINPRPMRRGVDSPVTRAASIANRRLLKQLAQKHTREAALKLKRRSMKARPPSTAAYKRVSNGQPLKRGSIKAIRLGPSGRLLKANSISNVATMEADLLGLGQRGHRRSNSALRIAERIGGKRLQGPRAPRRDTRPMWGANYPINSIREPPPMQSRSRSRTRPAALQSRRSSQLGISTRTARGRSNSRTGQLIRNRSRSRIDLTRPRIDLTRPRIDLTRSRIDLTRSRKADVRSVNAVPITSRLGRRPGAPGVRARSSSRSGPGAARRPLRGGVTSGRIQRRRNSVRAVAPGRSSLSTGGVQSRMNRAKGRLAPQRQVPDASKQRLNRPVSKRGNAVARGRARSRSRADNRPLQRNNSAARDGAVANRQRGGAQRGRAAARGNGRRGRSQQRGGAAPRGAQRNGNVQPQRRGRSRSRGRGSARGGRQQDTDKPDVKKEDLDKELDQYMSSTKAADGLFS